MASTINASTTLGLISTADTSGVLQLQTANTAALTINASQNVGVGTASPANKLHVNGTGDSGRFQGTSRSLYIATDTNASAIWNGAGQTGEGVYLNAASNQLDLYTGSTVKVRIDASGNLGLGVTPSAWYSTVKAFQFGAGGLLDGRTNDAAQATLGAGYYLDSGATYRYISTTGATRFVQASGAYLWFTAASGTAGNAISFTQAMTLDADGDLGVGITSPLYKIHSSGTVARKYTTPGTTGSPAEEAGFVYADDGSTPVAGIWFFNTFSSGNTTQMAFKTRNSAGTVVEAVRIDASQNLLVGTTSSIGGKIQVVFDGTAGDGVGLKTNNATLDAVFIRFINSAGSTAGRIYQNGTTSVSYVTSSDKRLKIDNGIATDTNVIDNAIVHDYQWKSNNKIERGLFAQEAYENKPESVFVGDDELTEDGSLKNPWGIDYSKYVPDLIVHAQQLKKQVQEQQAIIESLKARLDAANL